MWNIDNIRCKQCQRELVASNVEEASVDGEGARVTVRHLPCLECPSGHARTATSPDFAETLMDALFGDNGVPVAKRRGLLRRVAHCPRCRNELSQVQQPVTFKLSLVLRQPGEKYEVEFEHAAELSHDDPCQFSVELCCEGFTCGSCGESCAVQGAGLMSPVRRALESLFESL